MAIPSPAATPDRPGTAADPASVTAGVPAVRLESVTKTFGDDTVGRRVAESIPGAGGTFPIVAVDHVDLDVQDGEFFSMLGPSGSGKTTVLRMIAGFEEPTEGRVFLGEDDVTRHPPFNRDVNTVFQDYALFPHMSVRENVEYGLKVRKVPRRSRPRTERRACQPRP